MKPLQALVFFLAVIVLGLFIIFIKIAYFPTEKREAETAASDEGLLEQFKSLRSDLGHVLQDSKKGAAAIREIIASISNTNASAELTDQEIEALRQKLLKRQAQYERAQAEARRILQELGNTYDVEIEFSAISEIPEALFTLSVVGEDECRKTITYFDINRSDELEQSIAKINNKRLKAQCALGIFARQQDYVMVDMCENDSGCDRVRQLKKNLEELRLE